MGVMHDRSNRAVSADLRIGPDLRTGSARKARHQLQDSVWRHTLARELKLCCQDLVNLSSSTTGEEVSAVCLTLSSFSLFSAEISRKVQRAWAGSDKTIDKTGNSPSRSNSDP